MINQSTKDAIKAELNKQIHLIGSAKKLSVTLKVSNATISNIINDKTALISDQLWFSISGALGLNFDSQWLHADTEPFKKLTNYFNDARLHSNVFALVTNPGGGKTYAMDDFRDKNPHTYYVKCHRHTTERDFLKQLLNSMHVNFNSHRITDLLNKTVDVARKLESPSFIVDEFEKVKNDVFVLPIDIYNSLENQVGITIIGTPNLKTRIDNGVARGTMGYNELLSRVGGKVIEIPAPSHADACNIIRANGINDKDTTVQKGKLVNAMQFIIGESDNENNEVDLRRVKRLVHAIKQKGIGK